MPYTVYGKKGNKITYAHILGKKKNDFVVPHKKQAKYLASILRQRIKKAGYKGYRVHIQKL